LGMLLLFVYWECCYMGGENATVNCALGMIFLFVYCECCFL